jgi:hypothetical protein
MSCSICDYLERTYQTLLGEYIEARSSVRYLVSTQLAAQKNVDMERARYELEEHRRICSSSIQPKLLVSRDEPKRSRSLAA